MIRKKAWYWTLVLMVVSTAAVLSSPEEKSKSASADQAEPDVITNSIGMKLVRIPAGEFMMGAEEDQDATMTAFPSPILRCCRVNRQGTRSASRNHSTWDSMK